MGFDAERVRPHFPALRRTVNGRQAVYLDGPGGTQVPRAVVAAMTHYLESGGSNHGGAFVTSRFSEEVTQQARHAVADLFNADADEIAFGQNMTSITLAVSRALGRTWSEGEEVVVTRLDHDANVWPWVIAARDAGATVRFLDFHPDSGELDLAGLRDVVTSRTRLVAVTHASNALGTVVDVAAVVAAAHEVGALVYVDAVHYAPHGVIDVAAADCDFLVASAYKFFGPHTGVLYGRRRLLEEFDAVKIRPAADTGPEKWESGTQSFESLAGVEAAVGYLAGLAPGGDDRRADLTAAMTMISDYESSLSARFLDAIAGIDGVRLHGLPAPRGRTPTFALSIDGVEPATASRLLGERGIFTWSGHYYAVEVMQRLGVLDRGGLLRIGFVHYTTPDEVDLAAAALERLAAGASLDDLPAPRAVASPSEATFAG